MKKTHEMPARRGRTLLAMGIIAAVCIAAYSNTFQVPFVYDDLHNIRENHFIRLTRLNAPALYEAGIKSPSRNRPVANISLALNYYFGRYQVWGYHLVNVVIHLINGVLVFFLVRTLLSTPLAVPAGSPPPGSGPSGLSPPRGPNDLAPLFAALVFTAHPIQTQAVTYIVQRMASMAAMFYLLALLLFLYGRMSGVRSRRWWLYLGCLTSWIMSLACKEITVTLPAAVLLCEWCFFRDLKGAWLKTGLKYLPLAIIAIYAISVFYSGDPFFFRKFIGAYGDREFTVGERVMTQFRVVVFYISLVFFPHPSRLNLIHHVETSKSLLAPPATLACLLVIVGIIALALLLARRQRIISFCILWFFGHLVIESSVIGIEMIYEHRLYLPMFGVSFMAGYLFFLWGRHRSWVLLAGTAIILLLGVSAFARNQVWQDEVALWKDVLSKNPKSYRAENNLGMAHKTAGRLKEAEYHIAKALEMRPRYFRANNNMGIVLGLQGRHDEAQRYFEKAVHFNRKSAQAHNNLGMALARQGKTDEGIEHVTRALAIKPYTDAYNNLGILLASKGELAQAEVQFRQALKLDPLSAEAHNNLGITLERQGNSKEAFVHYQAALRIRPGYPDARNNMGQFLLKQNKQEDALRQFQEAVRSDPQNAAANFGAGNILLERRDLAGAESHFRKAVTSAPDHSDAHYGLGLVLVRQQKLQEAAGQFQDAVRLNPNHAGARNNLGIALALQGKTGEALEQFAEALRINPRDADAHCNLGVTLVGQGRQEEGASHLREALALNPGHADARRNLEYVLKEPEKQEKPEK